MTPKNAQAIAQTDHAQISDIAQNREQTWLNKLFASQPFWVAVALVVLYLGMALYEPHAFGTVENFANMCRNFALFGIMAVGMTVVIITSIISG